MNPYKNQTYRSTTFMDAILPTMKKLSNKHKNPVNFLKAVWGDVAPQWAVLAQPYMIRKNTLIMKTISNHAITLQYREQELLKLVQTVLGENVNGTPIERIKITSAN